MDQAKGSKTECETGMNKQRSSNRNTVVQSWKTDGV